MIGLALGGGGVRGSYQIGVYLALKKSHIKIDGFTGSSIGAFNAAMLASKRDKELLNFWQTTEIGKMFGFSDELIKLANSDKFDFKIFKAGYNDFIKALLQDDIKAMNIYMNRVALTTFSFFDSGGKASTRSEPERFYHGFVLGLLVDLGERYSVTSNRESDFGRYDVVLEPKTKNDDAIILEFKVQDTNDEKTLLDTVNAALDQIKCKQYDVSLLEKGIPKTKIRKYGFAFHGKQVLIGK